MRSVLVKLIEVYSDTCPHSEKSWGAEEFSIRETYINPSHVVCLREDTNISSKIRGSELESELDPRQEFTKLYIERGYSGLDITVVGSLCSIREKFQSQARELLNG